MEIALAHDYLTQRGGAERVALELIRRVGTRELITAAHVPDQTWDGFADHRIVTSRDPAMHLLRKDPRRALPILAGVWDRMPPIDADAVIASSSGWAHGIRTTAGTRKIVYCHNPARWLHQPEDYTADLSRPVRTALSVLTPRLKAWDQRAAASADLYLANSTSVATRIRTIYGIEAEVVLPPVTVDTTGDHDRVPDLPEGFFLTVGRARGYKGTDRLVEAFAGLPDHHLAIVGTPPGPDLPANVTGLGRVTDAQLRWLYAHAQALVSVSHEDFGLTPIEANAFATPVLVLKAGGFLDSTAPGVSGAFIADEEISTIREAVRDFNQDWDRAAIRAHADRFSPTVFAEQIRAAISRTVDPDHRARAGSTVRSRVSISSTAPRATSGPRP